MNRIIGALAGITLLAIPAPSHAHDETSPFAELLARSTTMWTGEPLPPYPTGTPEISVLRITVPPGTRLPLHIHPVINVAYVAKGALTIETKEGKVLNLESGDVMIEIVDIWHEGINAGDETVELIVVYSGVVDEPITVYDDDAEPIPLIEK